MIMKKRIKLLEQILSWTKNVNYLNESNWLKKIIMSLAIATILMIKMMKYKK